MLPSLRPGCGMTAEALNGERLGVITLPGEDASPRFEILGRPAAWRDGQPLDLGPGKQQAVLAVLLLTPNRPVPTTAIVDAVWGDEPPDNGANVVQKYVAGLRRVLEPGRSPRSPGRLLTLSSAGYVLHVPRGGLDADVFHDRVKEALAVRATGDAARAATLLQDALDMWHGPALAGLNGGFFSSARDRLEEERAAALEASAEIGLDLGEHARLVPELIRLVAEFPLREGFRYLLMLALYRSGRQAEALAAYRDARDFFAEEFGFEPGERLQGLHLGILRSDPALAAPATDAVEAAEAAAEPASDVPPGFVPPDPRPGTASAADAPGEVVLAYPPASAAPAPTAPAGYFAAPVAWAHREAPAGRRLPWAVRAVLVLVPLVSFGAASWALLAYFAARRKSLRLALIASGHLALTIVFVATATATDVDQTSWWDVPMMVSLIATTFGGAVHLAVLTAEPWPPGTDGERAARTPAVPLIEQRVRREQARSLVAHHPAVARLLRIGRPDLARTFDDGGLIDVNTAPEHVLAALPGLEPSHAKLIVLSRTAQGPLATVDDLVTRQIMPFQTVHALRETLIAVPAAAPEEIGAPGGTPATPAAGA
ncbi:BTAD domain-containing putative transcriptional regulator [Actinomadura sp. KC06]|uniref:BTAD domain-containing putative transcriptional regulator n=1 Tax=Actinomadura sp. KC06 TaxID=2530369 RepID=UPI0014052585|nr:BTAD domain-containing putative transcriptional regulator [Actinomadura sp. KC06]